MRKVQIAEEVAEHVDALEELIQGMYVNEAVKDVLTQQLTDFHDAVIDANDVTPVDWR